MKVREVCQEADSGRPGIIKNEEGVRMLQARISEWWERLLPASTSVGILTLRSSVSSTTFDNENWLADNPPLDKLMAGWLWPPLSGSTTSRSEPVRSRPCLGRPPMWVFWQPAPVLPEGFDGLSRCVPGRACWLLCRELCRCLQCPSSRLSALRRCYS
jgi:hypothetical protein